MTPESTTEGTLAALDLLLTGYFKRHPQPPDLALARTMSTDELRRIWDWADEGWNGTDVTKPVSVETVHRVLNERGEGAYCAV